MLCSGQVDEVPNNLALIVLHQQNMVVLTCSYKLKTFANFQMAIIKTVIN